MLMDGWTWLDFIMVVGTQLVIIELGLVVWTRLLNIKVGRHEGTDHQVIQRSDLKDWKELTASMDPLPTHHDFFLASCSCSC